LSLTKINEQELFGQVRIKITKRPLEIIETRLKSGLRKIIGFNNNYMKDLANIRDIESIQKLDNEYDLQKALLLDRKLRLMINEDSSLTAIHDKLVDLI
jgi:hypothetical protein